MLVGRLLGIKVITDNTRYLAFQLGSIVCRRVPDDGAIDREVGMYGYITEGDNIGPWDVWKAVTKWCGGCACAPGEREVKEIVERRPQLQPGEDFVGTPEQLLAQMQPFVELGVDLFILDCSDFPDLTTATMLVEEVLPALNR